MPYLTLVERRRIIERPSTLLAVRLLSLSHHFSLPFPSPFPPRFPYTAIIGTETRRSRRGCREADRPATRLRAWPRDIFKRTRLVLLAHHAGLRIVTLARARARARTRHSPILDAITARSSTSGIRLRPSRSRDRRDRVRKIRARRKRYCPCFENHISV